MQGLQTQPIVYCRIFESLYWKKMSQSNYRERRSHSLHPLPPIEVFKNNMLQHLVHGHKRVHLIQKIHRSYTLMHPSAVAGHRHRWLPDLIDKVRDKTAFEETQASMSLYFLWDKLLANECEWSWLSEISWYKAPSDDAIRNEEKRSGKVNKHPKPQVIPTMRTGLQPAQINVGHVIPYADKG
jgi:hypothetical protein